MVLPQLAVLVFWSKDACNLVPCIRRQIQGYLRHLRFSVCGGIVASSDKEKQIGRLWHVRSRTDNRFVEWKKRTQMSKHEDNAKG